MVSGGVALPFGFGWLIVLGVFVVLGVDEVGIGLVKSLVEVVLERRTRLLTV